MPEKSWPAAQAEACTTQTKVCATIGSLTVHGGIGFSLCGNVETPGTGFSEGPRACGWNRSETPSTGGYDAASAHQIANKTGPVSRQPFRSSYFMTGAKRLGLSSQAPDLADGNVDIQQTEAAERAAEERANPDLMDARRHRRKPTDVP